MTLEQVNINLSRVISDLNGAPYADLMVRIANDCLYMIKDRVISRGESPNETKLKPYSTNPILVSKKGMSTKAYGTIAGTKGKRKQLTWVTHKGARLFVLPYGYKQYRELHGRQTKHVDYVFTGRLWNNIKIIKGKSDARNGVLIIGATTPEDRNKMENIINRRGVFLFPTKRNIKTMEKTFSGGIKYIFTKNGFSV